MSILTFKVKHNQDFSTELEKSYFIALFAQEQKLLKNKWPTSKSVKHFGLPSAVSCQIIKKYFNNKTLKTIHKNNVKIILPGRTVKVLPNEKQLFIRCFNKLVLNCWFDFNFEKINQIEIDHEYAYISCEIKDIPKRENVEKYIGIDLNSTSHSVVIANQQTGNVKKLGKCVPHFQTKYMFLRKQLQKQKRFKQLKEIKNKNQRKIDDQLHKITTKIVREAIKTNCDIKLENLKRIRKRNTKDYKKKSNFTLNSWPFYKFKMFLTYKANLFGINVIEIDPKWTSQNCSRCQTIGCREGKAFSCKKCGHLEHADVNAAFNIAASKNALFDPVKNDKFDRKGTLISRKSSSKINKIIFETLEPTTL